MTTGTLKTQGTKLYYIDLLTSTDPVIYAVACPTGVTGLGGAADQLEDTCLDNTTDRTYKRGLGNPGQVSVPFNFIPSDTSHQLLFQLKDAGTDVKWLLALSDGTTVPTVDTDNEFVFPVNRTCFKFTAYIADINIDVATNEIVRGTLTLQRSGSVVVQYGPVPA